MICILKNGRIVEQGLIGDVLSSGSDAAGTVSGMAVPLVLTHQI